MTRTLFIGALVACGLAVGCADKKFPPPKAAPPPEAAPPAAITSAHPNANAGNANPSSALNISDEIRKACGIVDSTEQAPKFDYDSSDVSPPEKELLSQVAKCLTEGPLKGRDVQLVGRADARGEQEYNMNLGSRRADAVERYLQGLGVDRAKLSVTSRGELDATGHDEEGWRKDRRVDINLKK